VYVHVPFCESVCYYCACNKVITKHHDRAAEYLDALEHEIACTPACWATASRCRSCTWAAARRPSSATPS
jgi:coproporphyrinogen III oxidase-like Fe-S oxidoreductase